MKKIMFIGVLLIGFLFLSTNVFAGGRTLWGTPTQIDIERGNGIMVYGDFGNVGSCTIGDRFYVKHDHPEFDKIYSALMIAYTAKKKVRVYSSTCAPVGWYSVPETTYNTVTSSGDFQIKD